MSQKTLFENSVQEGHSEKKKIEEKLKFLKKTLLENRT